MIILEQSVYNLIAKERELFCEACYKSIAPKRIIKYIESNTNIDKIHRWQEKEGVIKDEVFDCINFRTTKRLIGTFKINFNPFTIWWKIY